MQILRLKELLQKKKITGKELVKSIDITETSLSRIIKGDQQPRFELLVKIANVLNVDIKELFVSTKDVCNIQVIINNELKTFSSIEDFKLFASEM